MTAAQSTKVNSLVALSDAMVEAVARAGGATVLVSARRRFPASGIGYAADLILTADHVVEREEDINIQLPDGTDLPAAVAGRDPGSDLALLRLKSGAVQVAETVTEEAQVGQLALALGRPSSGGIQASLGIISSIGGPIRTGRGGLLERYLATDAIPYPGFSGGPLVDASGRVLGINTSGLTRGASLAIPARQAWQVAAALVQYGHIRRGFLGIRSQPVELPPAWQTALNRQQGMGLLIVGVEQGGPAAAGGLMVGDVLVGIAGQPVADPDELLGKLDGSLIGQPTPVEILRGGRVQTLPITVGERK
jgi:S1-C subfamily serine protease